MSAAADKAKAVMQARSMRVWTREEDARLRRLLVSGMSYATAAQRLGRGYDAIRARARVLGLTVSRDPGRPSAQDMAERKISAESTGKEDLWRKWERANARLRQGQSE